jgi:hypothetical protein
MKLLHRFGYYFGGFALGLVFLAFFLSGKKASCSYFPNARTVKNISTKEYKQYSEDALSVMKTHQLDTTTVIDIIKYGDVDFSESDTKSKPCRTYIIENTYKDNDVVITVKNCDSVATITSIEFQ